MKINKLNLRPSIWLGILVACVLVAGVAKYVNYAHTQRIINTPSKPKEKWKPRPMETYGMETASCWLNVKIKGNVFRIPRVGGFTSVELLDGTFFQDAFDYTFTGATTTCHELEAPPIEGVSFDISPRSLPGFEHVITQILIDDYPNESFRGQEYRFFMNCVNRQGYASIKDLPIKDGFYQCLASYVPVDPKFTAPDGSPLVFSHGVIFPWRNVRVRVRLTSHNAVPLTELRAYYSAIVGYLESLELKNNNLSGGKQ